MSSELTDLIIEEISLVNEPANPDAQVKLFKAKGAKMVEKNEAPAPIDPVVVELEKNLESVADAALDLPVPDDVVEDADDLEKSLVLKKINELERTVEAYKRKERLQEISKYVSERWHKVPDGAIYLYEKCWNDPQALQALQVISNLNSKRYSKMVAKPAGSAVASVTGNRVLEGLEFKIAEKMANGLTRKQALSQLSAEDRAAFFAEISKA